MPCVFCGASPTTNEHVFPRWLNRFLRQDVRQVVEQARYGDGGFDLTRPAIGLDFRVNRVCATCNNGWMSDMEVAIQPVLEPIITTRDPQILEPDELRTIALWAAKTAAMTDLTQRDPLLPQSARDALSTRREVPSNTHIWLGACGELMPLVTATTVRLDLERTLQPEGPMDVGFYAPMKFGYACLFVLFLPVEVVIQHPREYYLALAKIWPERDDDGIGWPPPAYPRDGAAFEAFADRFYRELRIASVEYARAQGFDV